MCVNLCNQGVLPLLEIVQYRSFISDYDLKEYNSYINT